MACGRQYSKAELEALWASVNPGLGSPKLMAAIALAESSGCEKVVNEIGACGLWQIHPFENGCENALTNAHMAGEKLRSQGLDAWETYTNGSYLQYYSGTVPTGSEVTGIGGSGTAGQGGAVENVSNPVGEGVSFVQKMVKLFEFLTSEQGWLRLGKVGLGLFLLLVGVLGMANIDFHPVDVAKKGVEVAGAVAA